MCNGNIAIYITKYHQIYFAFYINVNVFVKHLMFVTEWSIYVILFNNKATAILSFL